MGDLVNLRFVDEPGDTPLTTVPVDYDGGGHGRWFVLPDGPDAGRRMYVWERRLGPGAGPTILLVHGNPECSYTYRNVVRALEGRPLPTGTRIVAMDHLGFGRSDQATFEMVDMHHAANLEQLLLALNLDDVTMVVHDWGGPIGIGAFIDHPDRLSNLVVLNSTVFPMPPDGMTYTNYPIPVILPWSRTASIVPDRLWGSHAASAIGLTPTGVAGLVGAWLRALVGGPRVSSDERDALRVFRRQFSSVANAKSSKRMVHQTPVWGHGYVYEDPRLGQQDNRDFYRSIQDRIATAWGPEGRNIGVAGVFGAWDPLAKPSVLDQWRNALPQIGDHLLVFEDVSHFVEEHQPDEIAEAIVGLLERTVPRPGLEATDPVDDDADELA